MVSPNIPDESESDVGKVVKASWGDRVVEAIGLNCEAIRGLGKANSVFDIFNGDGSDGDYDFLFSQVLNLPVDGLQMENLTIRAGVILTLGNAGGANGIHRIGVSDTLTMEGASFLVANGAGYPGGAGGPAQGFIQAAASGQPGGGSTRYGVGQPTGGGGGGGGAPAFVFANYFSGSGGNGGPMAGAAGGLGGRYGWTGNPLGVGALSCLPGSPGEPSEQSLVRNGLDLDAWAPGSGGGGGGAGGVGLNVLQGTVAGGAGGPGGGTIILEVNKLNVLLPGSAGIHSIGGPGIVGTNSTFGSGAGGGGGGGAGGNILLCWREQLSLTFLPITNASGGAGAAGGVPTFAGASFGCAGNVGRPGNVFFRKV